MSDPKLPAEDTKKSTPSFTRIAIWVIVGGIGLYLVITGLVGVITKGT